MVPRKCCVTGCWDNYNKEKVNDFWLPQNPDYRKRWIKAIPRENTCDSPNNVLYENHFPNF